MNNAIRVILVCTLSTSYLFAADTTEQDLDNVVAQAKKDIAVKHKSQNNKKSLIEKGKNITFKKYDEKKKEWDKSESGFSVKIGMWYIHWNQTSESNTIQGAKNSNKYLDNVKYNIDPTLATVVNVHAHYKLISGSIQYYSAGTSTKSDEKVDSLSMGLFLVDLIPHINTEVRWVKSTFDRGDFNASSTAQNGFAAGDFKSNLNIADLIIYPFNDYVGIGYRNYKYEAPLDFYLQNSSGKIISGGAAPVKLDGDFFEISIDNKKLIEKNNNYKGIYYSLLAGQGKLNLTSDTVGLEKYITDYNAYFADALLGYTYKVKTNSGFGYGFDCGYRYNRLETETAILKGDYNLVTKFSTEFHGPFMNLSVSY